MTMNNENNENKEYKNYQNKSTSISESTDSSHGDSALSNQPPHQISNQETSQTTKMESPRTHNRFWDVLHFLFALALVCSVLYYLIKAPTDTVSSSVPNEIAEEKSEVRLLSNGDIELNEQTSFGKRLAIESVIKTQTKAPLFEVSGNVLCSYRKEMGEYQWQFSSSDLLTLYTDWQKSVNDTAFYEKQLTSTKELAETKIRALEKQIERKKKLVKIGTDTEQDLASSEAELLQVQIEEHKNIYSAETELRAAKNQESTLSRQLELSCLKPKLLEKISQDHDIIRANIPGSFFNKVSIGQECQASFQNLPGIQFTGKICEIIPVLSQELGMLCVLFVVQDPEDYLRPGMFADIGIGTEAREIITVPPAAVVHIGDSDFVLTQKKEMRWSVQKIQTGNLHKNGLEIISGLSTGDRVIGQGVILLKGYMSEIVDLQKKDPSETKVSPIKENIPSSKSTSKNNKDKNNKDKNNKDKNNKDKNNEDKNNKDKSAEVKNSEEQNEGDKK